jgi:hypothetical protein
MLLSPSNIMLADLALSAAVFAAASAAIREATLISKAQASAEMHEIPDIDLKGDQVVQLSGRNQSTRLLDDKRASFTIVNDPVEDIHSVTLYESYGAQLDSEVGNLADVKLPGWCLCAVVEETPTQLHVRGHEAPFARRSSSSSIAALAASEWIDQMDNAVQPTAQCHARCTRARESRTEAEGRHAQQGGASLTRIRCEAHRCSAADGRGLRRARFAIRCRRPSSRPQSALSLSSWLPTTLGEQFRARDSLSRNGSGSGSYPSSASAEKPNATLSDAAPLTSTFSQPIFTKKPSRFHAAHSSPKPRRRWPRHSRRRRPNRSNPLATRGAGFELKPACASVKLSHADLNRSEEMQAQAAKAEAITARTPSPSSQSGDSESDDVAISSPRSSMSGSEQMCAQVNSLGRFPPLTWPSPRLAQCLIESARSEGRLQFEVPCMKLLAMEAIAKAAEKKNKPRVKLIFGSDDTR